jgi:signal transduction histidine kinase
MYDAQLIGGLIVIGILTYSAMIHGMVYFRLQNHQVHGAFSVLCLLVAAYVATNVIALYFVTDAAAYVATSKVSSVFVIFTIIAMAWFASEYLLDNTNIPIKPIIILLVPFLLLNFFMENGILWSSIDGIELSPRSWGSKVMTPMNPVISIPMYGLWVVIAVIYFLILRAAYLSFRRSHRKRGVLLLATIIMLTIGFVFDALIDMGVNNSYFYVSEYVVLAFVVLMSLHLSDELRLYSLDLESMVSERTRALEQVNKELESFSYSVSHDLRGPLRAIHGFVVMLKEDYIQSLDGGAQEIMHKITSNVRRMQFMIDGLLDLSKISRGEIVRSEVNVSQLVLDVVKELQEREPGRQVDVAVEENMVCHCDPALVRILLENIIGNAWKYTSNVDNPKISVSRSTDGSGTRGYLISDNGAGFNEEYADKLFMPFQRLHEAEEFPGIGIGLATVERIVKRHGGTIWAKSKKNEGAKFFFSLQ